MRVEATTVIQATPEQVWAFITVPENGPRWQEGAIWTRVRTPGATQLGSEMDHLGRWLGMRIPTVARVTVYEPLRRYGYDITTRMSRRPSLMRYTVEPATEGTRLTLSNEAQLPALMRPFEGLLERNVQGMFERDVKRLKGAIESDIGAPGRDSSHG